LRDEFATLNLNQEDSISRLGCENQTLRSDADSLRIKITTLESHVQQLTSELAQAQEQTDQLRDTYAANEQLLRQQNNELNEKCESRYSLFFKFCKYYPNFEIYLLLFFFAVKA
jgi:predicted  nucleic acid-binding Zn-ribbon protein